MLRQGRPAGSVFVYLPVSDAWAGFAPGRVNLFEAVRDRIGPDLIGTVLDAGFTPELVDDEMLRALARIEGVRLRVGDVHATTVILPAIRRMPPDIMALLERFASAGGHVVATRRLPDRAPGFTATDADSEAVARGAQRLFGPHGAGRLMTDDRSSLSAALRALDAPDLVIEPGDPDIGFLHRRTGDADVYFIANTSNRKVRVSARARTSHHGAESWDAVTGAISPVPGDGRQPGVVSVPLILRPYESRFLVFTDRNLRRAASGKVLHEADINSGWTVRFGDGEPRTMDPLRSWLEDPHTRYFSGTATYERSIAVPDTWLGRGRTITLDFGTAAAVPRGEGRGIAAAIDAPVREAAVVFVNEQRVGSVWCPPYALDITAALHAGRNLLRVVVGNLAINRMAWEPPPSYRLLNLRYGVRFEPQDMTSLAPVTSGLLGPIRLVASARADRVH
jgi:hypothetical protein